MYAYALILHGVWRWVVVLAGATTVLSVVIALARRATNASRVVRMGRVFAVTVDIQMLLGAGLYLLWSPLTTSVPSATPVRLPEGSQAHYFNVVHPIVMLIVIVGVHLSSVLVNRAPGDGARLRRAALAYGLTFVILLLGIPWWRPWWRL